MKKPKPGKHPTQDALDKIGYDIERRKRAGEKFPTCEELRRWLRQQPDDTTTEILARGWLLLGASVPQREGEELNSRGDKITFDRTGSVWERTRLARSAPAAPPRPLYPVVYPVGT